MRFSTPHSFVPGTTRGAAASANDDARRKVEAKADSRREASEKLEPHWIRSIESATD